MTQKLSATNFVQPIAPPVDPQPAELRPTFQGQVDSLRFVFYGFFGALIGLCLRFLAQVPAAAAIIAAGLFVLAFVVVDLLFSTGLLHKWSEQQTERLRIEAAFLGDGVDSGQEAAIAALWDYLYTVIEPQLDAMKTIRVSDRDGVREVPKVDTIDLHIRRWLTGKMFDETGRLAGVHPNMQIRSAVPFKESIRSEEEQAAYQRLAAAGLIGRRGNDYVWTGPQLLSQTMERLAGTGARSLK